jgi:hypothetical protein
MPYYLSHANTQTQADQPQSRHVVHLPDGHSSCYRTPGTHLGSSCWEPSWVTISGRGRWLRLGVGPGQAGALGLPPCDPPGPASRIARSRGSGGGRGRIRR